MDRLMETLSSGLAILIDKWAILFGFTSKRPAGNSEWKSKKLQPKDNKR